MIQEYGFSSMLGSSDEMTEVFKLCAKLAKNDAVTVLVTGDSGTGKELVARALHDGSPRSGMPFMTINCSVLTETLIASELFGYEKGAFTDAKARKLGIFEMAKGGTVFLDEIGDMPHTLQAKILRVLEDKTFKRVGGTEDINVDVRIISATNQPLEERIATNDFRQDLFYRLNVAQIHLPPLRERGGDLQLLAGHFLAAASEQQGINFHAISDEAMDIFKQHSWPGNVRELKNVIERTVLLYDGPTILPEYAEAVIGSQTDSKQSPIEETGQSLPEMEKQALVSALEKAHNNQTRAARILGITRDTLRYRLRKYKL
jgi:two-component system NtrC family response regulator